MKANMTSKHSGVFPVTEENTRLREKKDWEESIDKRYRDFQVKYFLKCFHQSVELEHVPKSFLELSDEERRVPASRMCAEPL
jgi:hypothetical protein